MTQYLMSMYQPDGPPPASLDMEEMRRQLDALNDELRAVGSWVFSAGLCPPTTATVVGAGGAGVGLTDGPYLEGHEHLGGFTIVECDDLDQALAWGRRLAEITTLPIEVRPFQGA